MTRHARMPRALLALLASLWLTPAWAEDLDSDDLSDETTVQPVDWEPIVTRMYIATDKERVVADEHKTAMTFQAQVGKPGLVEGWRQLKPLIAIHDRDPYRPEEPLISGWRRPKDEAGGYEVRKGPPLYAVRSGASKYFYLGFDVLMTASDTMKDEVLQKYFRVLRWSVELHKVSDNPSQDDGTRVASREIIPGKILGEMAVSDLGDVKFRNTFLEWGTMLDPMLPGIYEIRTILTMRGRLRETETPGPDKTVQGAIRFIVTPDLFQPQVIGWETLGYWTSGK